MQFDAFDSFADTGLEFPLGQKTYLVAIPDTDTGLQIARLATGEDTAADKPSMWLWELALGTAYQQMVDDRVPLAFLIRAGQTAVQHFLAGEDAAKKMWREGPDPLAVKAAIEQAQAEASKRSPSTGGENRTQRRASSKATTSPKE